MSIGVIVFEVMISNDREQCTHDAKYSSYMYIECNAAIDLPLSFFRKVGLRASLEVCESTRQRTNKRKDYEKMPYIANKIVNNFIHDQTPALSSSLTYFEGHFRRILLATNVSS